MRYYEIYRTAIEISDEDFNEKLKRFAFCKEEDKATFSKEQKDKMFNEQRKFIKSLRSCMCKGGNLEDLEEYNTFKMAVAPSDIQSNAYIVIFFDKKIDPDNITLSSVEYDEDDNTFYIED